MNNKPESKDITVFISNRDSKCSECGKDLGKHAWIILKDNKGAVCLTCADLDHLVFLPSGNATLTRRSRKYSQLSAVVLKWSRKRKRYERQGLLVEHEAVDQAEQECAADAGDREVRRAQAALRRAELDQDYISRFSVRVRELFPHAPAERENLIAEHACRKYSGRVGRSAAAKDLEPDAVSLAVRAHVRHTETNYDKLLSAMVGRRQARAMVADAVDAVLQKWS